MQLEIITHSYDVGVAFRISGSYQLFYTTK